MDLGWFDGGESSRRHRKRLNKFVFPDNLTVGHNGTGQAVVAVSVRSKVFVAKVPLNQMWCEKCKRVGAGVG